MEQNLEKLKYPIGKFECPNPITETHLLEWTNALETLPQRLEDLVAPLSETQLDTPYRPGGWTVRQLVHHVADSHHHSYIRFKWAMTEDTPVIKPYVQTEWAQLPDSLSSPISLSLAHLKVVHAKLVNLLRMVQKQDLERKFIHPEGNVEVALTENMGIYAWHGNHHYAHIKNLVERKGW
ncbi:MAG: YfiT family bacillithiol transferase [Flavobacteriaceae bacterium]